MATRKAGGTKAQEMATSDPAGGAVVGHPYALQDAAEQAPVGDAALQQVRAHEDGEPDEVGMDPVSERQASEHHGACDGVDDAVDHEFTSFKWVLVVASRCSSAARPRRATRK